jgi:metallo-beta-lactamase family protein
MQIKLSFLGAAENVTGSRHLIEVDGIRVLVDCGLYQGWNLKDRNWDKFQVDPASIDAVLITHAHLDHCGLLPKLVKEGFKGKVICTKATADLAEIVLLDSGHIQEEDAEYKKKRHRREGRKKLKHVGPLYTTADAEACVKLFRPVDYQQEVEIGSFIKAKFYDAGHILGASMIKLDITSNGDTRTVLFSGDIGRGDRPILEDPTLFEHADYVLIESTYGDRVHESFREVKDQLCQAINKTYKAGGNVIIPSFSIERAQELLYYINELQIEKRIPNIMTFVDSPMAARATQVFKKHPELFDQMTKQHVLNGESPFDFPGLKYTRTARESKAINNIKGTVIVIAGSGMCTGGRIKHHIANNITRPESTLLFVGYQAMGTLGRRFVDGETEVRVLGQTYPVAANVERIFGFSGHADRDELLGWLTNLKRAPRRVFVVHGEKESAKSFAEYVTEKTGWSAVVGKYQQTVILD